MNYFTDACASKNRFWPYVLNLLAKASARPASAKHHRITASSAECEPWPRCGLMSF